MGVLGWVLFGFAVGLIARAVLPGRDPMGVLGTTLLGVMGALLGGWIGAALGWYRTDEGAGFVAATVGAVLVLFLYNALIRRRVGSGERRRETFGGSFDSQRKKEEEKPPRKAA
jgi:uncharacterized membrane protein YeaQ/YmgE (transglycosylase-associated protein family)